MAAKHASSTWLLLSPCKAMRIPGRVLLVYPHLVYSLIGGHQRVDVVERDFELAFAKDNEDELGTRDPKFEYYGSLALLSLSLMAFVPGTFTRSESRGAPGCGRL